MSMSFSDYAYYAACGGQLPESKYNAVVYDAYMEIVSQTNGAALTAPAVMADAVKLCECKLADVLSAYRDGDAMLPKGIASVSNDGYSVSRGSDGATASKAKSRESHTVCARYLQTPVNLMCRWA